MASRLTRLQRILGAVEKAWGPAEPPPVGNAFEHVLWENVGYLVDDARRAQAFAALAEATDLRPEGVLAAARKDLVAICKQGGIHPDLRAGRLVDSARRVLDEHDGDVACGTAGPLPAALRALRAFPAIGRPGAEKILLLTGTAPLLALDSNGLRSLQRLGYGGEHKSYDRSYREAQVAAAVELPEHCDTRTRAFLLLRELGRRTCRNRAPECGECPARRLCPSCVS